MKFSIYQVSRRGARLHNEDRVGYCYTREAALFLLADGMGGHPEGDVAAHLALKVIAESFERAAHPLVSDAPGFLVSAIHAAHQAILDYARSRAMPDTPRTTLVVGLIQEGRLHWLHCGDSRLYLMRDGVLMVRTRDHSMAERFAGSLGTSTSINRNILYTCLGSPLDPEYDLRGPLTLLPGDKLLLCSDGFWSNLDEEQLIADMFAAPVYDSVPPLVEQALKHGGHACDNVTVLALDWEPGTPDALGGVVTDAIQAIEFASTLRTGPGAELDPEDSSSAAAPGHPTAPSDGTATGHLAGKKE